MTQDGEYGLKREKKAYYSVGSMLARVGVGVPENHNERGEEEEIYVGVFGGHSDLSTCSSAQNNTEHVDEGLERHISGLEPGDGTQRATHMLSGFAWAMEVGLVCGCRDTSVR